MPTHDRPQRIGQPTVAVESLVLRDGDDEPVAYVRRTVPEGWLWACALCAWPAPPASHSADTAVRHAIEHNRTEHGDRP